MVCVTLFGYFKMMDTYLWMAPYHIVFKVKVIQYGAVKFVKLSVLVHLIVIDLWVSIPFKLCRIWFLLYVNILSQVHVVRLPIHRFVL